MATKSYIAFSAIIFGIIALLHLARVTYGWPAQIGNWEVPTWVSWIALVISAYLALSGFSLLRKRR